MKVKSWYLWCVMAAVTYVMPIILANVSYTDDMGRILDGYGWSRDGRVFADYVLGATSFGNGILTVFPFSLMLSAAIYAISGIIISNVTFDADSKIKRLSGFILIASPFLLENMAYKFDALPMSLSVFFAVLPFSIKNRYYFIATSIACLVLTFGLYQTSAMLYLGVALCIMIKKCSKNEKGIDVNLIACTLISFFIAYGIYSYLLLMLDVTVGRTKILPFDMSSINIVLERLSIYSAHYKKLFDGGYKIAVLPVLVLAIVSFISMALNGLSKVNLAMIIVYMFGLYLLVMLPNLVLVTGWVTARTFVCFPLLIYAIVIIASQCKFKIDDSIYVTCLLVLFCFSFFVSSVFGSALKINDDYSVYIAQSVSNDIAEDSTEISHNVIISGARPVAINNMQTFNSFPFLYILAPTYMVEGWTWGIRDLSRYMRMNFVSDNAAYVRDRCSWTVLKRRGIYNLLKKNNIYMVDFNYKVCEVTKN